GTNGGNQRLLSKLYGLNVGIAENAAATVRTLQIAPNPSSGATVFSASRPMPIGPLTNAQLTIHDGSGRVVWQAAWPAGAERYTLPAGALAPGAYVVRVSRSAGSASRDPAGTPVYTGRLVVMPD
ncbi:MAG: T9SS type A sorting domain-containing protein, partial [Flavobacteriales bacterium]